MNRNHTKGFKYILSLTIFAALILGILCPFLTVRAAFEISDDIVGQGGNYTSILYDNKNGLPTSEANAIAQTKDGFIWIGSYSGLIRYDGYNFIRINSASGIASVVSLLVDSKQRLWIGTNDNGLALMGRGYLRIFGKSDGLSALSIRSIQESSDGTIYIGTTSGLCTIGNNLKIEVLDIPQIKDETIYRLEKGSAGTVYGLTGSGAVFVVKGKKLEHYYDSEKLGLEESAHVIMADKKPGYVYLGTEGSKVYYGKLDKTFEIEKEIDTGALKYINAIKLLGGKLWVCTDNGAGLVIDDKFHVLNYELNNAIEDMMMDYQGNIWFTSSKLGVMKIVSNPFVDISKKYQLKNSIATTTCMYDDKLFIGNKNGGIIVVGEDGEETSVRLKYAVTKSGKDLLKTNLIRMLNEQTIRSIIKDNDNNLWISTYSDYGLIKYDGEGVVCYTEDDGMPTNRARVVYQRKNGDILAGCIGGVVVIRNDEIVKVYDKSDGITNTEVLTVCESASGDMLVGTDGGGMFIIGDKGLKHLGTDEGLSSDIIMHIKKDPKRDLYWVVTSNAIGYMDAEYNPVVLRDFMYSNNFDIVFDRFEQAWVLSSNGIYVVPEKQLLDNVSEYEYSFYDSGNGLPCIATANSYNELTEDGDLYIAGTTGVCKVNLNKSFEDIATLKIDVPYIEADGKLIYADDHGVFNLPASAKKIDITGYVFTYSLMNPEITYYLRGFDNQKYMVKRSEFSTVSYTNLPGGKYRFVMNIQNAQGTELKIVSIDINKTKTFYEYFVVKVIFVLAGMALIALAVWRLMHITIISRQYEEIRASKEETDRANAAKSQFLANMSHEIRTPINTIIGMNEMILRERDASEPDEYLENVTGYARNIKLASESLLELINQLLDLSKIESGKMELVEQEFDTNELLQSLATMIRVRSNQKDLTFSTDIDEKLPKRLYGDVQKLKEVILNLLTNAVKYTDEGGFTLIVKVNELRDDFCSIYFAVKDTGIGIKEEDMGKLFTAFRRLEEVKNSGIQGTGLGLDISRQYVELMGGCLLCESVYGEGSTFFFTIDQKVIDPEPIGEFTESVDRGEDEKYVPIFVAPEGKVLVVDDNEMNLQVIKGLLKRSKLQLALASSGQECLDKLEEESFHLVFLDHMMPGMDGIETLQKIREKYPDLIVIALTANVMNGGADFYKKAGFQDYLSKPVDAKMLEEKLKDYLPKEVVIEEVVEKAQEEQEDMELPENMKWLYDVEGIDVETGIRFCGMPQQFIKFAFTFYDLLNEKANEIETAYKEGDIKLYTIKVHALKSTARMLGAAELSALAEELEKAGNENDIERIDKDTEHLLEIYRSYKDKLAPLYSSVESEEESADKPEIAASDMENAYKAIAEFAPQMDYDAIEIVLEELKEYSIPKEDMEKVDKIEKMLKNFDWDGIEEFLK
ncbi:MAG: response regulator [Butyrivibrio sp.]|nr:response regulator [Butyrivibrio sp.]